MQGEKVHYV